MKEKKNKKADWSGYTLGELAYRRAITLAKIEITKEHLTSDAERFKKGNFFLSGSTFRRIMQVIDYSDIFVIGLTLWKKLSPLFSRKKR